MWGDAPAKALARVPLQRLSPIGNRRNRPARAENAANFFRSSPDPTEFHYLRQEKLWGLDDPLFPSTKIVVGDSRHFEASGLDRKHWSSAGPIRTIFKDAFAAAGLPYFNPHSFRKTLALLGGHICKSPEEYKAWSQNLGHENVLTTFSSYGDVARHRQAEIIRALGTSEQHACISSSSLIVLPAKAIFDGANS